MARKSSDRALRKSVQQKKLLEHLAEYGNVSYSCKRTGISRETYYQWREDRPFAFEADIAIDAGKSFVNDLAQTSLVQNIQKGDMQAVRFQLISCHPDYKPRRPGPAEDLEPVTAIEIRMVDREKMGERNGDEPEPGA